MDNFGMTMLLIIVGSFVFTWLFCKFAEWLLRDVPPYEMYYWEECKEGEEGEKND